jgi:hypothetical protein
MITTAEWSADMELDIVYIKIPQQRKTVYDSEGFGEEQLLR